jgi:hypothetical protein
MRHPVGTIRAARLKLQGQRLRVLVTLQMDRGEEREAQLPDREVAAILPRSVLLGASATAPTAILDTARPIVERMCLGRRARVWRFHDRWFLSFLSWKSVRFRDDPYGPMASPS